jgi:hypothetical protein
MSTSSLQKPMRGFLFVLLAGFLVFPSAAAAEDTVQLAYSFDAAYSQKFKCEYSQSQDFYGMNYVILIEMEITENCVEVLGDTAYKMEIIFDEVSSSMTMNDNLRPNNFDEAFKGQTVSYQVDKYGDVSGVKAKSYIEGWRQHGEMVRMALSGFYPDLPNKAVKPGEKWDEDTTENPEDNPGLEVTTKIAYEFKEMKNEKGRECAKILAKAKSTYKGLVTTPQGELDTDGNAETEAEFFFDVSGTGIVKLKVKAEEDAKLIQKATSPGGKDEEFEMHRSYEIKKELK